MLTAIVAALLLPPLNLLLLAIAASLLLPRWPRMGRGLLVFTLASGYLLCSSAITGSLLRHLERPLSAAFEPTHTAVEPRDASAIVVLGGGSYFNAPEYGGDTVGRHTLERLRWAARLQRNLQLPLLVSGGSPLGNTYTEAAQMRDALVEDFEVPVRWMEAQSINTYDSAFRTFHILRRESVSRIVLVTHAAHMRRATLVFEHVGFEVAPAPTGFTTRSGTSILDFLPSAHGLEMARNFFHELVGIGWYHLRLAHAA